MFLLSRVSPEFIMRLFEQEVPEVFDGIITIKNVVRIPGERAKVAVESYDDRIDPVGACVGARGARVRMVVNELRGEKIDIVPFSEDPADFVMKALSPAKIKETTPALSQDKIAQGGAGLRCTHSRLHPPHHIFRQRILLHMRNAFLCCQS